MRSRRQYVYYNSTSLCLLLHSTYLYLSVDQQINTFSNYMNPPDLNKISFFFRRHK